MNYDPDARKLTSVNFSSTSNYPSIGESKNQGFINRPGVCVWMCSPLAQVMWGEKRPLHPNQQLFNWQRCILSQRCRSEEIGNSLYLGPCLFSVLIVETMSGPCDNSKNVRVFWHLKRKVCKDCTDLILLISFLYALILRYSATNGFCIK